MPLKYIPPRFQTFWTPVIYLYESLIIPTCETNQVAKNTNIVDSFSSVFNFDFTQIFTISNIYEYSKFST